MTIAPDTTEQLPDVILQQRYQIVRRIGQGGMGAVFEAIDTRLGSVVAIKQTLPIPLEEYAGGEDPLRRAFEREARILASLRHPALPVVSDFFAEDTAQYLVMQYIPGDDLWALIQQQGGPFPTEQVLEWADSLLDVLDYLHTHQPPILHRDIKPQNLKLTPRNEIVLLDFGLARGGVSTMHSRLSSGGSLVAYTPQYAPMEQIRGLPIGARSDLYALAATLYHLLTGHLPASAMDRAAAAMEGRPDPLIPVATVNPQVSQLISDLLMRAMSPRVEERPPNAAAMRAFLRRNHRPVRQMATTPAAPAVRMPPPPATLDTVMPRRPVIRAKAASPPPSSETPLQRLARLQERIRKVAAQVGAAARDVAARLATAGGAQLLGLWSTTPAWMQRRETLAGIIGTVVLTSAIALTAASSTAAVQQTRVKSGPAIATPAALVSDEPTATQIDPAVRSGYQRAVETLSAAISVHPEDPRNYLSRAEAYLALQDFTAAIDDYEHVIELNPSSLLGYLGRAQAYATQRSFARAIEDYTHVLTVDPTQTEALTGRAQAYYEQSDFPNAIDDYGRLIDMTPSSATGYLGRGQAYMRMHAYRQALADFDQAISNRSDDPQAYVARGLAYVSLGEFDRAIADYDTAVQIEPANADAYLNRGRAAFYQRAYERAIADYDEFLKLRPASPLGLYNRGLAHSARGDQALAIADFDAYITQRPDDADIYLYRAMAYARIGQPERAQADLQKCLALTTDPDLRAQAEQQLQLITNG